MKTEYSEKLFAKANELFPGGVNSPVRAFRGVGGTPRFIARGRGSRLWDVDGNEYVDYVGSWGPLILGHCHPAVMQAVQDALREGASFGAPSPREIRLGEAVRERMPWIEKMRFVSSGTEATTAAIRLARGFTGRDDLVKFDGCYHGAGDALLVKAGSGVETLGLPDSPGVPADLARHTLTLPWNDLPAVERLFEERGASIAAVITEPVVGNMGVLVPGPGYLEGLSRVCREHGALFIVDEVMTGLRVAPGGACGLYGLHPDLVAFGKVIGGGLPVGAFGGRADIMDFYDPRRGAARISHGGTFNANPVTMAAGVATLGALTPEAYERLDALGERLRGGVTRLLAATRRKGQVSGAGSLFWLHWTTEPLVDYRSTRPKDGEAPMRVFLGLLNEGILLTQRGLGACSLPMTDTDVDRLVNALARVLARS